MKVTFTLWALMLAIPALGGETFDRITIDLANNTVAPEDPVVNVANGRDVFIEMVSEGKPPNPGMVDFRLQGVVYRQYSRAEQAVHRLLLPRMQIDEQTKEFTLPDVDEERAFEAAAGEWLKLHSGIEVVLVPTLGDGEDPKNFTVPGSNMKIHFLGRSQMESRRAWIVPMKFVREGAHTIVRVYHERPVSPADFPLLVSPQGHELQIFTDDGGFMVTAEEFPADNTEQSADDCRCQRKTGKPDLSKPAAKQVSAVVGVMSRRTALTWSGGVAFFGTRDKQYQLRPVIGSTDTLEPYAIRDAGLPYRLSVFGNYMGILGEHGAWLGVSVGAAVDVPVNSLTFMGGPTVRLRVFPLTDSLYLTGGLAYSKHKDIAPAFEGLRGVPATTELSTLTADRYALGVFVAIHFGFAGGNGDAFKAVVSGKGAPAAAKPTAQ